MNVFLLVLALLALGLQGAAATSLPEALVDADFHPVNEQQAKLGQQLFYDKIISGNKNISCATCHHPRFGTSDGLSLGIGEGGEGVGPDRTFGGGESRVNRRVPRNAPALWNLGAKEFSVLFHDGRSSHDDIFPSGFNSPADEFLPTGLTDIVAVQAIFPITADVEMAGDKNENEIPSAVARRVDYAWDILVNRVKQTAGYETLFVDAFVDVNASSDISIVHVANALSAFQRFEFRADNSPFDQYLRGSKQAMTLQQISGMNLFYGEAGCSQCHKGALQTDHQFHNLALPFIGPGRTRRFDFKARDMGRINESDLAEDAYKFRTPSLRNVTETGPYGHNGAYQSLADIVLHHADPKTSFQRYDISKANLPQAPHLKPDELLKYDKQEVQRMFSTVTNRQVFVNEKTLPDLLAFLSALTDVESLAGRLGVPDSVPSNLPVDQ